MKLLAISDMHGNLQNVIRVLNESPCDLLLSCGDWGDPEELDLSVMERIISLKPVLSVYGNHDDLELLSRLENTDETPALLRNGEIHEIQGLRFAGINGIWAKSHRKPHYITDEEVDEISRGLAGRSVDVLLTHGCPVGLADIIPGGRHGGQRCFLEAFHTISPRLHLCGHLHVAQMRALKDDRLVVNVGYTCEGDYWTFDLDDPTLAPEHHRL